MEIRGPQLDGPGPALLAVGTVIQGDYEILRVMGRGGMGEVYEARHTRLPKRFALKVIRRELVAEPGLLERFRREAEITSSLGNPHIVDVSDFNVLPDGSPFMVMELLQGEDLAERLRRQGRLTLGETRQVLKQLAIGLGAAHQSGVLHRDIKPENIFLARVGGGEVVKVLDFGISKVAGASRMTLTHSVIGTPAYMSPEQASGSAELDARADVYAVGVVLYQLLGGRLPFEGENPYQLITKIVNAPVPSLHDVAPELPAGVVAVVASALAKSPADRPASMEQLWRAFDAASANAPSSTASFRSDTLGATLLSPVPRSAFAVAAASPSRSPVRRAILALLVLLVAAGGAWLLKQRVAGGLPETIPQAIPRAATPIAVPAPEQKPVVAAPVARPTVVDPPPAPGPSPAVPAPASASPRHSKRRPSTAPAPSTEPELDSAPYGP